MALTKGERSKRLLLTLYGGQFTLSTLLIILNYMGTCLLSWNSILPHHELLLNSSTDLTIFM